jgi:diamine N-acetyltransferase
VHDAETGALAGFAMISDNVPQPMGDDLVGPYYLWKLLIDYRFQRRGYGAATLDAVVGYLRTRPCVEVLYTSCADGPGSRAGSISATASPTPAGSCGARTASR